MRKNLRKLKRKIEAYQKDPQEGKLPKMKDQPINMVRLLKPKGWKDDLETLRGPWFKNSKKGV